LCALLQMLSLTLGYSSTTNPRETAPVRRGLFIHLHVISHNVPASTDHQTVNDNNCVCVSNG